MVDGALPATTKRLADAVHALVEPFPVWHGGICRLTPPLYVRLRAALRGTAGRSGRRLPASRLPCRGDVLALLVQIDSTTAEWNRGTDTADRLRALAARTWRPQDCQQLDDYSTALEAWTHTAAELLGDRPAEIALRLPCPACSRKYVYRLSSGENVRSWALRVSEDGARCQHCHATWTPGQFEWLARVLGCPELPT
ncbi:hypothetical protein MCEMAEM6B_02218 [Mycobacteriaceae bacterium]